MVACITQLLEQSHSSDQESDRNGGYDRRCLTSSPVDCPSSTSATTGSKLASRAALRSSEAFARYLLVDIRLPVPLDQMAAVSPGYSANRAVNVVGAVCAAAPGILTTVDLPQVITTQLSSSASPGGLRNN